MDQVDKATRKAKGWFYRQEHKRFGPVGPAKKEQNCDVTRAYLTCYGYLSVEQKRVDLSPTDTLQDARDSFGRPMRQQKILDENNYELQDLSSPLWNYTKNCNVSLNFRYSQEKELEAAAAHTKRVGESSVGMAEKAMQSLGNAVASVGTTLSNSGIGASGKEAQPTSTQNGEP